MVELLAPAGNPEALDAAIGEGADAVYLGLKSFNARLRSSNFAWNQFEAAVNTLHRLGKKIYVTVNTVSEDCEMERLYRFLSYLDNVGPDGLIVQDFGVVRMVQEFFPKLNLHASTQMNVASAKAVNLLGKEGVKRVVLARELDLDEILKIKAQSTAELEVFIHGALCVCESGLCLFSSYLGGKSANRGMCTQACRRLYQADSADGLKQGYYFSPNDLQLIDKIPDLITAGVASFKIEGRMKSAEYVGSVTAAYRYVIDHWENDKKGAIAAGKRMLATDFARSKTGYWYDIGTVIERQSASDETDSSLFNETNAAKKVKAVGKNKVEIIKETLTVDTVADTLLNPRQAGGTGIYLGTIEKTRIVTVSSLKKAVEDDLDSASISISETALNAEAGIDGKIILASLSDSSYDPDSGDSIRLHRKDDTGRVSHKVRASVLEDGKRWIDIPEGFSCGDSVYLLQTKSMSRRYPRILPNDLGKYRRQPGAQKLPILDLTPVAKNELSYFPEGIYIQVSTLADIHIVQSEHPVRVILELNSDTKKSLFDNNEVIPLSKKQIWISLDPYCPEAIEDMLSEDLNKLIEMGFSGFVVNNPSHIAMLKGKGVSLIAGPYLYTFNRWAVSWLENQNIGAFITPLENSRHNLEDTFEMPQRSRVMVNIFAWPALFRMRFKLPSTYEFNYFTDKEGMVFKSLSTPDGSFVMPDNPFSILDKVSFLKSAGFSHFLIDLSKIQVKKNFFKQIMTALYKQQILPETDRFNWKDGFYSPEKIEEFRSANERAAIEKAAIAAAKKTHSFGKGRVNQNFTGSFHESKYEKRGGTSKYAPKNHGSYKKKSAEFENYYGNSESKSYSGYSRNSTSGYGSRTGKGKAAGKNGSRYIPKDSKNR